MCAPPLSDTNTLQVSSIPLKELKKIAYYRIYMNSYLTQQIFHFLLLRGRMKCWENKRKVKKLSFYDSKESLGVQMKETIKKQGIIGKTGRRKKEVKQGTSQFGEVSAIVSWAR